MKKLKSKIREWIFNGLLELLFKFSNSHKLVKFNRLTKGDKIYYELSLRATIQTEGSLRDIEEKTSEYLKNLTLKNIELDEEQDAKSLRQDFSDEFIDEMIPNEEDKKVYEI